MPESQAKKGKLIKQKDIIPHSHPHQPTTVHIDPLKEWKLSWLRDIDSLKKRKEEEDKNRRALLQEVYITNMNASGKGVRI